MQAMRSETNQSNGSQRSAHHARLAWQDLRQLVLTQSKASEVCFATDCYHFKSCFIASAFEFGHVPTTLANRLLWQAIDVDVDVEVDVDVAWHGMLCKRCLLS